MSDVTASIVFRREVRDGDAAALRELVEAAAVFYPEERQIALELLEERLHAGEKSGYHFIFAETQGQIVGYAVWGPIPLTRSSFDLYWIVVDPHFQGTGVGQALLAQSEADIARLGGGGLYIETSSRDEYMRTRAFYLRAGYAELARFGDFYAPGDDKFVYRKMIRAVADPV